MADQVVAPSISSGQARVPALNLRDIEVLQCLAAGRSTAQIAVSLSVSGNTARTRIRRLQSKLDVIDRDAAVRAAENLGVLGIPRPRRPAR